MYERFDDRWFEKLKRLNCVFTVLRVTGTIVTLNINE